MPTDEEQYSDEETKRRFEAALRGARDASPHLMGKFVGKGKRGADSRKSRIKGKVKIARSFAIPRRKRFRAIGSLISESLAGSARDRPAHTLFIVNTQRYTV
jgi:hypothetical protein